MPYRRYTQRYFPPPPPPRRPRRADAGERGVEDIIDLLDMLSRHNCTVDVGTVIEKTLALLAGEARKMIIRCRDAEIIVEKTNGTITVTEKPLP